MSDSYSEEEHANDRLSDDQEDCGRVTAEANKIEIVSVDYQVTATFFKWQ